MKILLIDDDVRISQALRQALAPSYEVDCLRKGAAAATQCSANPYDLVLLDLGLPDLPGAEVCRQLRGDGYCGPLVVISGEAHIMTKIKLLDIGADDYLTKPFSLGELKARLRALTRRANSTSPVPRRLVVGNLVLDANRHTATRGTTAIQLRRKEFALLECLMLRAGSVVTREVLTAHAWRSGEDPWTNTIDVHIKYLRDKIDRHYDIPLIKTVHGIGYKIEVSGSKTTSLPLLAGTGA